MRFRKSGQKVTQNPGERPESTIKKSSWRRRLILAILCGVLATSLYFLAAPYLPKVYFLIRKPRIDASPYAQAASTKKTLSISATAKPGNRIILPDIGIDAQIYEGKNISVISKDQGVWRETSNRTPNQQGNIVIAGHRFMYRVTDGGRFYNLPEMPLGSVIYLVWEKQVYAYKIYNSKSVLPSQIDIRNNDPQVPRKLTLYTCYPLGSTAQRFVVEARQI